jgi:hypothetical protein
MKLDDSLETREHGGLDPWRRHYWPAVSSRLEAGTSLLRRNLCQPTDFLRQAGIKAIVCERESPEHRPRDWGMTLHWANEAVNLVLPPDLQARIHEACCDPSYQPSEDDAELVAYAGHTGEVLMRTPASNAKSVSRRKMRTLFSEGLDIRVGLASCSSGQV